MNHPIDKLFREKLSDLEVQLPSDAWERVQQQRGKRNGTWKKWLSIAATLVIVISSYFMVEKDTVINESAIVSSEDINSALTIPDNTVQEAPAVATPTAKVDDTKKHIADATKAASAKKPEAAVAVKPSSPVINHVREMPEMVSKITVTAAFPEEQVDQPKKVILPQPSDAFVAESTLFDKIANTAREIKNHDGMMAELRELKDDVISLEFFKTKKSI